MKHLYDPSAVQEVKTRVAQLRADSERQWGKMTPAQALAHCSLVMGEALGDRRPPRDLMGKLIGRLTRGQIMSDKPMMRNAPTAFELKVTDERDIDAERQRLCALVDRFTAGGPAACTTHPHSFFGAMTPHEWATWMYKHLDHHLRQFSA